MSGNRHCAWAVCVPTDESVESALLTAKMLRKQQTAASVVALVSYCVDREKVSRLEDAFNFCVVRDTKNFDDLMTKPGSVKTQDLLMVSAMTLTSFWKVVVLAPGVVPIGQSDQLFDERDGEASGNFELISQGDGLEWKVVQVWTTNGLNFSRVKRQATGRNRKEFLSLFVQPTHSNGTLIIGDGTGVSSLADLEKYTTNGMVFVSRDTAAQLLIEMEKEEWMDLGHSGSFQHEECDSADWVAIVGMACRFPQANTLEEYWSVLENGRNTCSTPPDHRLSLVDMDPEIKANFLKCPIDQFDAGFFGISPSEAGFTDPQARLLLEVSWEAFEEAGINPQGIRGTKSGIFYGSWLQEYREALNCNGDSSPTQDYLRKYLGNGFGSTAAKLSYFYGFTGPNVSTESGCSSSMMAVDMALKSLQRRECPLALACGANLILYMTKQQKVWAVDGRSKTFDAAADGYARAEGIAVLVMKRYSDAIRDGDRIHGIIRGSASSQEGLSKNFGAPTVESELSAMRGALSAARVDPCQVDYVEAHATGTSVGDPIEAAAIVKAYSAGRRRTEPLWVASGKTNMGHSESCSGMAGIIKVLLSMEHETIPAHVNFTSLNPQVDFSAIPAQIPVKSVPWPRRHGRARIAGVSSFGITGTDVHVILQEAPQVVPRSQRFVPALEHGSPRDYLLTLSAKSEVALYQLTDRFKLHLQNTNDSIQDIAFSASTCRAHHPTRKCVVGASMEEIISKMQSDNFISFPTRSTSPKICFAFPGKFGDMEASPIRHLYETVPFFKQVMDECDASFQRVTGRNCSLVSLLFRPVTEYSADCNMDWYALVPTCQYSLAKFWMYLGVLPHSIIGHCFGELTAYLISGCLELDEFYKILNVIPHFVQCQRDAPALTMAINASSDAVKTLVKSFLSVHHDKGAWIDVTSVNSHDQTVVGGSQETIPAFRMFCKEQGIRCKIIPMDFCVHSRAVEPSSNVVLEILNNLKFKPITIPYISSASGKLMQDGELNGRHLWKIFRDCVNFAPACKAVQEQGLGDIFLEVGFNDALTKFTRDNLACGEIMLESSSPVCISTISKSGATAAAGGIAAAVGQLYALGMNINWGNYYGANTTCPPQRVKLPLYPFQRKSFWMERKCRDLLPELHRPSGVIVHPFLGATFDTPWGMDNFVIFQNDWFSMMHFADWEGGFIGDHVIGAKVIFPGAGFLEMMLAAWKLSMGDADQQHAISVKNFKVHAPLLVDVKAARKVQCVANKETGVISVAAKYARGGQGTSSWKLHASATIVSLESLDSHDSMPEIMNMDGYGDGSVQKVNKFYDSAFQVGLQFGEAFRSLKSMHTNESGESLFEVGNIYGGDYGKFALHPILMDAMIQAYMLHRKNELQKLHVPVQIGSFKLFPRGNVSEDKLFIHCETGSSRISLLDAGGYCLARMENLDLVATSVESVIHSACSHEESENEPSKSNPLTIYDVSWEMAKFYQASTVIQDKTLQVTDSTSPNLEAITKELKELGNFSPTEVELDGIMNKLCRMYVVKMLFEVGWTPEMSAQEARETDWGIIPGLAPAFQHYLSYVGDAVECNSLSQVEAEIRQILSMPLIKNYVAMETIHECGSNLAGILRGSVSPHKILFDDRGLADRYYQTTRFLTFLPHLEKFFKNLVTLDSGDGGVLRILEVGAGTGAFPRKMIPVLNAMGRPYEYHFTDISPTLVKKAKQLFPEEDRRHFVFKTLNLEVDPLSQGFPAEYFDLVVAVDVLHATRDLNKTLAHISMVTKHNGRVLLGETEKPVREVDICFGILEGYWLFEDGIRRGHCTVNSNTWLELLAGSGFTRDPTALLFCQGQMSVISAQKGVLEPKRPANPQGTLSKHWLVFHFGEQDQVTKLVNYMEKLDRHVCAVSLEQGENLERLISSNLDSVRATGQLEGILVVYNEAVCVKPEPRSLMESLLLLTKYLLQSKMKALPRFCLVTEGCWRVHEGDRVSHQAPVAGMGWGFMRNVRIELPGIGIKCIDLESGTIGSELMVTVLMSELWVDDKEAEVVYRGGSRYVKRLRESVAQDTNKQLSIPETGHFHVELPQTKVIADLRFVGGNEAGAEDNLADDQLEIQVRCVSLNFRDVFTVMKPIKFFEGLKAIGLDYSGVVTRVGKNVRRWKEGDAVFGCEWVDGCMKSHVTTDESWLMAVPKNMTFVEAATLPAVFLTAWYCMVNVAKLQKGQTILVHAASGGVGLTAIQIAKILGVRVIGTAGSERKRKYVRELGVEHVFNSRTLEFGESIKELTQGQGVDMVLNCLTGPGFKEASLELCRDGGHFVEISKLDIWSEEEVEVLRPLVHYEIVDARKVENVVLRGVMDKLCELLETGEMKPLPYTSFPACRLPDAMGYLQKAKQIGKVIINMPHPVRDRRMDLLFNERSSYLITGGKGAIGFAVCKWMLSQGAKYVVLVGRGEASEETKQEISQLEKDLGAVIIDKQVDISDYDQVHQLVCKEMAHLPPLRGVHHCAGLLSDKMIAHQDWENFLYVFKPKVEGAWNLHRATLSHALEHFVLYSSAAATFGHAGQSNYVAANAFLDHLAQYRRSLSLPALSINWGKWRAGLAKEVVLDWLPSFSEMDGVEALDGMMRRGGADESVLVAGIFEFPHIVKATPAYKESFLEALSLKTQSGSQTSGTRDGHTTTEAADQQVMLLADNYKALEDSQEKVDLVRIFILRILSETLGISGCEIPENTTFSEMGMDSLMSIEFTNKIHSGMESGGDAGGGEVFIDLEENGTLNKLTSYIAEILDARSKCH